MHIFHKWESLGRGRKKCTKCGLTKSYSAELGGWYDDGYLQGTNYDNMSHAKRWDYHDHPTHRGGVMSYSEAFMGTGRKQTDVEKLAEDVALYKAKYEAMAAEGRSLAKQRHAIVGDYVFDESGYKKLPDLKPALSVWKKAQGDSITIIDGLLDLLAEASDILDDYASDTEQAWVEKSSNFLSRIAPLVKQHRGE